MAKDEKPAKLSDQARVDKENVGGANVPAPVTVTGMHVRAPIDPAKLKVKQVLTMPILQCSKAGQQALIEIIEPIHQGKQIDPKKEAAWIANVWNLMDGRQYTFIFAAVVKSEIERSYPDASYVGKQFAIECGEKEEGKRFRAYKVVEVDAA